MIWSDEIMKYMKILLFLLIIIGGVGWYYRNYPVSSQIIEPEVISKAEIGESLHYKDSTITIYKTKSDSNGNLVVFYYCVFPEGIADSYTEDTFSVFDSKGYYLEILQSDPTYIESGENTHGSFIVKSGSPPYKILAYLPYEPYVKKHKLFGKAFEFNVIDNE